MELELAKALNFLGIIFVLVGFPFLYFNWAMGLASIVVGALLIAITYSATRQPQVDESAHDDA